jgi:hypothetical protein
MPRERLAGMVVIIAGIIITLIVVFADVLGITDDPNTFDLDTFRYNQQLGTAIGILVVIAGFVIYNYGERFIGGGGPPGDE